MSVIAIEESAFVCELLREIYQTEGVRLVWSLPASRLKPKHYPERVLHAQTLEESYLDANDGPRVRSVREKWSSKSTMSYSAGGKSEMMQVM